MTADVWTIESNMPSSQEQLLNVAAIQFELLQEQSLDAHVSHMEALTAEAVESGAQLIVFPEFSSVGLLATLPEHESVSATVAADYRDFLAPMFPAIASRLADMAKKYGITILGGSHNRVADDGSLRNTAVLAHPDGRLEYQDKIHLTPPEHAMGAVGGTELLITQIGPFKAGVLICADIQFPELSRHLMSQGVELIVCPSLTWNRRGVHRVKIGCSARAIENQMYVVMSPLIGSSGLPGDAPMYATGKALVTTPVDKTFGLNDGTLALASGDGESIVYATLDRNLLLASRDKPETPGLKLHRPDLYRHLRETVQQ